MASRKAPSKKRGKRGKRARRRARPPGRALLRLLGGLAAAAGFAAGLVGAGWLLAIDREVVSRFEGRRFDVPSRVFSAPLIVYPGTEWQRVDLGGWLRRLGYRDQPEGGELRPGRYDWRPGALRVHLRAFDHPQRPEPARELIFHLAGGLIERIEDSRTGNPAGVVVLEPEPVSAFLGENREQRDLVALDSVPRHLVEAIYAVEDKRFEEHHGIDPRRVVGALIANLKAGRVEQGASTLTQQLVKNFFLTPERTLRRKLREAAMALVVEARYSKPEILEAYLNEIYLGQRGSTQVHGVGEAARLYFGKSASRLSISESALIAAIIQSPNGISPHRRGERARARRDLVLALMFEQGRISGGAYEEARSEPLQLAALTGESGDARYFLDALSQQLPDVYDADVLSSEGLRIYSTLDPRIQRAAARALREGLVRIEKGRSPPPDPSKPLQGCVLAMRPQTGEILALVGGRDYGQSQWNRCVQARRQVGSVFKPFVYVAALEPGSGPEITLADRLEDAPVEILDPQTAKPWRPENYDHRFRGPVSVREALERSLNVPAVRLGQRVGIARVAEVARALGITSPLPRVPSLALGTAEVAPLEVARAYATLANGGRRATPRMFIDVVGAGGVAKENRPLQGAVPVLDPATAYLAVSLLEGVVDRGTARRVRAQGMRGPVAGKTGTTDDEFDLWFVGFTPELVTVVWVGFDEPAPVGMPSSQGALPIWTDFMMDVLGQEVRGRFPRPAGVEALRIDPRSGALALAGCPRGETEFFIAGSGPTVTCPPGPPPGARKPPGFFRRTLRRLFGSSP
ncbi:MAG: PBP1A family penicillin-binding protein [Myxococcota bacterium]|nr:PBP1A family penicillin-binding protein [Myxococcota bacterium]